MSSAADLILIVLPFSQSRQLKKYHVSNLLTLSHIQKNLQEMTLKTALQKYGNYLEVKALFFYRLENIVVKREMSCLGCIFHMLEWIDITSHIYSP